MALSSPPIVPSYSDGRLTQLIASSPIHTVELVTSPVEFLLDLQLSSPLSYYRVGLPSNLLPFLLAGLLEQPTESRKTFLVLSLAH